MIVRTHISNALREADDMAQYDAEVKRILANKTILAYMLKYTVEEFKYMSVEQIRECIEGEPQISKLKVRPGHTPEVIRGINTEDKVPGEGRVTYDIRFYAILPGGRSVKLIMDIEAQKTFNPGYNLVTRGMFYCCRMLSSQMDVEFTGENYGDIKKVYSIFICMKVPKYIQNTITKYDVQPTKVFGDFRGKARYDLLTLVMICLGKEDNRENRLLGMLNILLSDKLPIWKKEEILSKRYGLEMEVELKEAMDRMCNLSELVLERGIREGEKRGRKSGIKEGKRRGIREGIEKGRILLLYDMVEDKTLSLSEAARRMDITEKEFLDKVNSYRGKNMQ